MSDYVGAYVYIRSEPGLYTVGFYDPAGGWHSESDHDSPQAAADRVTQLNGGDTRGKEVVHELMKLALEVAVAAPIRRNRWSVNAYVPWQVVEDIRRELDRLGIDWLKSATALRRGKGYGS